MRYANNGNNDHKVSKGFKAYVLGGFTLVVGVLGDGASKDIAVNWNSPFEEDTAGGVFEKTGGMIQVRTHRTSKGKLASDGYPGYFGRSNTAHCRGSTLPWQRV